MYICIRFDVFDPLVMYKMVESTMDFRPRNFNNGREHAKLSINKELPNSGHRGWLKSVVFQPKMVSKGFAESVPGLHSRVRQGPYVCFCSSLCRHGLFGLFYHQSLLKRNERNERNGILLM